MGKITQKEFINKLVNFDSALVGNTSNKSLDDIKSTIDKNLDMQINFNREAVIKGQRVIFNYMQDNEIKESNLSLYMMTIYQYRKFYIVEDKYENYCYYLIYAISDKKTLNLEELKNKQIQVQKELELKNIELEKKKKEDDFKKELKEYFQHLYWNKEKTNKLTPLQFGRLKKSLEKQYRYDGIIKTVKQNIEDNFFIKKEIGKAAINWKHYDKLLDPWNGYETEESKAYKEKIEKKKIYELYYKNDNGTYTEIPKIVFDILIDDFSIAESPANSSNLESEFKNGDVEITKDNIHLYYEFMSDEDLKKYSNLLSSIIAVRFYKVVEILNLPKNTNGGFDNSNIYGVIAQPQGYFDKQFMKLKCTYGATLLKYDVFEVKDTLNPIDEYIEEIKASKAYKEYIKQSSGN